MTISVSKSTIGSTPAAAIRGPARPNNFALG